MTALASALTKHCWWAVSGQEAAAEDVRFEGTGGLPSAFAVTDVASAVIAAAGLSIAKLSGEASGRAPTVVVDRRLSSMWFLASIRPIDWQLPAPWDPIAGDYLARDGWIRLHTNAPHHRAAVERALRTSGDKEAIARAVATWGKTDLENAVIDAGGCAAEMRSIAEWAEHPQGRAIGNEPLVHSVRTSAAATRDRLLDAARPLEGVRVLDLTRVLAGPVAGRFLAGYGADVLRIDPPGWDEPAIEPEVTLGKRCARLDLRTTADRLVFERLLSDADILLHGYRPGALEGLGYNRDARRTLSPGLVDVSLDAYGWSGPWAGRRGFDSLVQMSTGIADHGMQHRRAGKPVPLPVQALDHATGYLMAAAAVCAIVQRLTEGVGSETRLSLARTASLLIDHPVEFEVAALAPETNLDRSPDIESTSWGRAQRIRPPLRIEGAPIRWDIPAHRLGSDSLR